MIKCTHVDAFTSTPFAGNPACVIAFEKDCDKDIQRDAAWMQKVALEMNLSETVYVQSINGDGNSYDMRWFTPGGEVDLCGHATLAAAHNLWERGLADILLPISFNTKSGILTASKEQINGTEVIVLDFPKEEASPIDLKHEDVSKISKAFNIDLADILFVGRNRMDVIAQVTPEAFHKLEASSSLIKQIECRVLSVTAASTSGFHFMSRSFAPRFAIDEDPVCGSAHCALGPFWAVELGLGESIMNAKAASPRRGELGVRVVGDRVLLSGTAVSTMTGIMLH